MADKLTVGRIEKLSDTPFTAKLSADYQVKAVSAKDLIERGKAEGRAEAVAEVISWLGSHTIPAHPSQFSEGYRTAVSQVEELRNRWVADGKIAGRASANNT